MLRSAYPREFRLLIDVAWLFSSGSALTLLVTGVFANDAHDVLALDDFAILTQAFD
jgi:hypothetical protein